MIFFLSLFLNHYWIYWNVQLYITSIQTGKRKRKNKELHKQMSWNEHTSPQMVSLLQTWGHCFWDFFPSLYIIPKEACSRQFSKSVDFFPTLSLAPLEFTGGRKPTLANARTLTRKLITPFLPCVNSAHDCWPNRHWRSSSVTGNINKTIWPVGKQNKQLWIGALDYFTPIRALRSYTAMLSID